VARPIWQRLAARGAALVVLGLVWCGSAGDGTGAPKKSDAVVKVTARADKPGADGKQTVTVTFDIDKGWHIYANPVGEELLAGGQTVVNVTSKEKLQDVKVEYPAGKLVVDKTIGNHNIYEGKVTVKVTVQRAKGDTGPLEVSAKFQACDKDQCLQGATVKVPVE